MKKKWREYKERLFSLEVNFDDKVGKGAANPYTRSAYKTMSCCFRRIKEALREDLKVLSFCGSKKENKAEI